MQSKTIQSTVKICAVLVVIQTIRILVSQRLLSLFDKTSLSIDAVSMVTMIIITILMIIIANKLDISFSFPPKAKTRSAKIFYVTATLLFLFLAISAPLFTQDTSVGVILPLLYSVVVTPVFEELIFRGYVWNSLREIGKSELRTYVISTGLFALWHLGYIDVIWLKMSLQENGGDLLYVMLMKVAVGLFFGIVIGFVRYKTKNTYAAMLMHGVMNVFGR